MTVRAPRNRGPAGRQRHRSARRTVRPVLAPVAALALVLTACSADDGGPVEATAPDATATDDTEATATGDDGSTSSPAPTSPAPTSSPTSPAPTSPAPTSPAPPSEEPPSDAAELPRGGTEFFPHYRLFGYSGHPRSEPLGRLGIGDLDERIVELEERSAEFVGDRELMPVLELITVVVHPVPGQDGMYRTREPDEVVQTFLDAADRHDALLLLNIQPGMSSMIDEVRHYEKFLVEPNVGVALDPEWDVREGQIPGQVYGHTRGEEIDEVARYLADLVEEHDLPQKALIYHQVHRGVVSNPEDIGEYDSVVIINSIDGIGHPTDKIATYDRIMQDRPDHVVPGFKLFYEEDAAFGPLMTGEEVLGLDPVPEYILWE